MKRVSREYSGMRLGAMRHERGGDWVLQSAFASCRWSISASTSLTTVWPRGLPRGLFLGACIARMSAQRNPNERGPVLGAREHQQDEPVSFANRDSCIAAARQQARGRHTDAGVSTEVWAPGYGGTRECIVRYPTPADFNELLLQAREHSWLRLEGCTQPTSSERKPQAS